MNRTQKKRLFQGLLAMGIVLLVLSLLLDGPGARFPGRDALRHRAPACWPWRDPPC